MIYKILADITVALHLAWIVFLFLGAFWGVRSRQVKVFHLSGLGFAALIQVFDWYCPLTHLEVYLRARHNPATSYAGDFVIQYLEQVVYLQVPPTVNLFSPKSRRDLGTRVIGHAQIIED